MHSFDADNEMFEFHTILGYTDGISLFEKWKNEEESTP